MDDIVAAIEKIRDNAQELHEPDSRLLKVFRAFRRHTTQVLRHPRKVGDFIDELKR